MTTLEGMLAVKEVARRLGRSQEQVRRYLREGKLAGRRIGNQWFVDVSHLRQIVAPVNPRGDAAARKRGTLLERVRRRREKLRRRWEKMGVRVDAAALVRELREES